jgi:hypothetical protein
MAPQALSVTHIFLRNSVKEVHVLIRLFICLSVCPLIQLQISVTMIIVRLLKPSTNIV